MIEPTRHDNNVKDADQASGIDGWMGYDEREHIQLSEAIGWAVAHPDEVTLFIYDENGGIYIRDHQQIIPRSRMTLPTALTEPLCFCDVDGCFQIGAGGANIAVGDGAAWCRLKAPFVSSGDFIHQQLKQEG